MPVPSRGGEMLRGATDLLCICVSEKYTCIVSPHWDFRVYLLPQQSQTRIANILPFEGFDIMNFHMDVY